MKFALHLKNRILKTLALSSALLTVSAAHASVTDWGVPTDFESAQNSVANGLFSDVFAFTTNGSSNIASVAVSNNLLQFTNISAGAVTLYQGIYGDPTPDFLVSNYNFTGNTGSSQHEDFGLASGSYFYEVSGNATGTQGGQYQFASSVTPSSVGPVPEPETYAMLLAGLGFIGFIGRRKGH